MKAIAKAVMRKLAGSFGDLMKEQPKPTFAEPKQPAGQLPKAKPIEGVKIKLGEPQGTHQPWYDPREWLYPYRWDKPTQTWKWNWGNQIDPERVAFKRVKIIKSKYKYI